MDTSRSGDWTAEALVFSGLRNPRWSVDDAAVTDLVAVWNRLPPRPSPAEAPLPLGYRGCELRAPDGRVWRAAAATVTLRPPDGAALPAAVRDDPDRRFERRLIATAPPGALPRLVTDDGRPGHGAAG